MTNPQFTTAMQPPPGKGASLSLPSPGPNNSNPPIFNDAMTVRVRVFVDEQNFPAEVEMDDEEARSWHWVLYASEPGKAKIPVATIRVVPNPHPAHELLTHPDTAPASLPKYDWTHEPYIRLTRVAVLSEYRGKGLGRVLCETALAWAREHAKEINEAAAELAAENEVVDVKQWEGLVIVHAQTAVEEMYRRVGFETDPSLGKWDEEGVPHVGMVSRIALV